MRFVCRGYHDYRVPYRCVVEADSEEDVTEDMVENALCETVEGEDWDMAEINETQLETVEPE